MIATTIVLLGSPLLAIGSWGELPGAIEVADPAVDVLDVPVSTDDVQPFGQRYLTAVVLAAHAARPRAPLALVGHSAAGPLLPGVGRALRDAGYRIGAYVFLDASLPGPGRPSRLDLIRRDDEQRADVLYKLLDAGGKFPNWQLPGVTTRPRSRMFFEEPLPTSDDWPDAPCGYVRTSSAYESASRQARVRGWPVIEAGGDDHLPWRIDPTPVARQILRLLESM